jgi:adenylyl-sulfate kinase
MSSEHPSQGFTIWLTGLPSSGKSSLAASLSEVLRDRGIVVQVLDSDDLRKWLTPDPTYSEEERKWFYQSLVRIAELLTTNGVNVLIAATAPRRSYRDFARMRISHCAIVYVDCPVQVCRKRDTKGLWKKADQGEIENFPGVGFPFEEPEDPEVRVNTEDFNNEEATVFVVQSLLTSDFLKEWVTIIR